MNSSKRNISAPKVRAFSATLISSILALSLLTGCGEEEQTIKTTEKPAVLVNVEKASPEQIQIKESSIGRIESLATPMISAEVSGRVTSIEVAVGQSFTKGQLLAALDDADYQNRLRAASADVNRIIAMLKNEDIQLQRYKNLQQNDFVSRTKLDSLVAQKEVLNQQLDAARAQEEIIRHNLNKTKIFAPLAGKLQKRMVSVGDYVNPGKPMFQASTSAKLQVILPFPEVISNTLRPGLPVTLTLNIENSIVAKGTVTEIRPDIGSSNLSSDVIIEVSNPGGWKPGASVDGVIVIDEHSAIMVSDLSVVQRPGRTVAYIVTSSGVVKETIIETGYWERGRIEVTSGISAGDIVVTDGAYFLSDGAKVRYEESL
ncbi:MAG: efflux RND transporter periplasmic adaptor subunit [Pseudomonadales bacterium]|nr:efflux RND transporter periplasmic adaptor subunit [Pseudomonadales bacterium]